MNLFASHHHSRNLLAAWILPLGFICLLGCSDGKSNGTFKNSQDSGISLIDVAAPLILKIDAKSTGSLDADTLGGQTPPVIIEPNCELTSTTLSPRPPEVLLVLDRSNSMVSGFSITGLTKWDVMANGIYNAIGSSLGAIAWGLMLFPKDSDDNECCQMPTNDRAPIVEVDPVLLAPQSFNAVLTQTTQTGVGTPTAKALIQAANYMAARSTSTSKYLVLATWGDPTCASDNLCTDAASVDYARTKEAVTHVASVLGIPVAIIGPVLPSSSNQIQPNIKRQFFIELATLGGLPNTSDSQPAYYAVSTASELALALGKVQGQTKSCTFAIPNPIEWPDNVAVEVSGNRISKDTSHQDGWDYGDGNASVILYGKPCNDARQSKEAGAVQFVTSCPAVSIE